MSDDLRRTDSGTMILGVPSRSSRPNPWLQQTDLTLRCPFCPGHECDTPPELARMSNPAGEWLTRAVPNRYPLVGPGPDSEPRHEVIVETPHHSLIAIDITSSQRTALLAFYHARFVAMSGREGVNSVSLFRNHGPRAGASLEHPHGQLIGLDFIPPRLAAELDFAQSRFTSGEPCSTCQAVAIDSPQQNLQIERSANLVLYAPLASRVPFEMRIAPAAHRHDFQSAEPLLPQLAHLLHSARYALDLTMKTAAYNWTVVSAPAIPDDRGRHLHWYLEILPRLTEQAGFEWNTGLLVNIVDPEETAARIKTGQSAPSRGKL